MAYPGEIEFLKILRRTTNACGRVLIFDEVMTGFHVVLAVPRNIWYSTSLTALGKVIGGGLQLVHLVVNGNNGTIGSLWTSLSSRHFVW